MKKVIIKKTKNIEKIEFCIPESAGVYLLVGANGSGKTTLMVCLDRICNRNALAHGFYAPSKTTEIDEYKKSEIIYDISSECKIICKKKNSRWSFTPKNGQKSLSEFGFNGTIFVKADSKRIDVTQDEIKKGKYESADVNLIVALNEIFETSKFDNLKRFHNAQKQGRPAVYFYIIKSVHSKTGYSEKRFSTGELAILRLVERLIAAQNNTLVLIDEAEMALHPRIQKKLLDYLQKIANDKKLTVLIATHSVTMIKATDKNHIILLKDNGEIVSPCYSAEALGTVDFIGNAFYDALIFVEDEMARDILKAMIKHDTTRKLNGLENCLRVIPVGGYMQTANLAIEVKNMQDLAFSCAVWDGDVFANMLSEDEEISSKYANVKKLYDENKDMIFNLGLVGEVAILDKLEKTDDSVIRKLFRKDFVQIKNCKQYKDAKSTKKDSERAKAMLNVIVEQLAASAGETEETTKKMLIDLLIKEKMQDGKFKGKVAMMFDCIVKGVEKLKKK